MIPFVKANGLGNDFIIVERSHLIDGVSMPDWVRSVCDRKRSVGADGVIVWSPSGDSFDVEFWNEDGTQAGTCGNGLRCFAELQFSLLGLMHCEAKVGGVSYRLRQVSAGNWSVTFPKPIEVHHLPDSGSVARVQLQNEHWVKFVDDPPRVDEQLQQWSESEDANCHYAWAKEPHIAEAVTWERGAGPTLACGSGACAIVLAGNLLGLMSAEAEVQLPGGSLQVQINEKGVHLTGAAEINFIGVLQP